MSREAPIREEGTGAAQTPRRERQQPGAAEEGKKPRACDEPEAVSFLFDDPYWDDVFDSYHDPTLRTCCRS